MLKQWLTRLAGLAVIGLMGQPVAAQTAVYYPGGESSADARLSYPLAVLDMCQTYLGDGYRFMPSPLLAQQQRNLRLLAEGHLDVLWTVSTAARERDLLPVRIPIDRGLIGWRLLLVRQGSQHGFADVDLPGLALKLAGQGHDWPDLAVLRANGFNAVGSSTYEGLFAMLAQGHIDYFPRAISEIWRELASRPGLDLAVAPGLVLHYPEQLYFFVNRNNARLAKALGDCLTQATEDGALKRLFYHYFAADISRAALAERRVIRLALPGDFPPPPELPASFWFHPGESP